MVVHEDNERPLEVAVIRKPLLEQMTYVIVNNHVRELTNATQNTAHIKTNEDEPPQHSLNAGRNRIKQKLNKVQASFGSDNTTRSSTEIDPDDLQELKRVYKNCKQVMNRIETKYGHLLDLDSDAEHSESKKRKECSETMEHQCQCMSKKKIIFDDDGQQVIVNSLSENHICEKKLLGLSSMMQTKRRSITVEYNKNDDDIILPDDLTQLSKLLQDKNITKSYRNKVLKKIRSVKQDNANELKLKKRMLIEKLKSNPDDVLDFKGTNLSTIPGYI